MTLIERKLANTNLDNIPDEMKNHSQWICWKADKRANGKITKIPINPSNGKYAKTDDPETWGKLTDADAFYRSNGMDGIGFVFTENDPFIGIDLDNCIDHETGKIGAGLKITSSHCGGHPRMNGIATFLSVMFFRH